jgi:hypothetical protein
MERQSQEFKAKMKVSNPLNDIAANLGVTPKVLTQLATGEDKEFRELVRGIFSILPENEVMLVASDEGINPEFLDYLARLFVENQRILLTILQNPSANTATRQDIIGKLPENMILSIAGNPQTSPVVLQAISESSQASADILATLLANASTPADLKERILSETSEETTLVLEEEIEDESSPFTPTAEDGASIADDVDAKIALCVDKLYQINADIVTEFIKKARMEILKRLNLIAKANRLILSAIVQHPSLSIEDLERIDLDMFASLLKKSPEEINVQTVLDFLQQAEKNKQEMLSKLQKKQ